jgi:hypothetical protein
MHISYTLQGSPYVVVDGSAINVRYFIGKSYIARRKYGKAKWQSIRNLWLNMIQIEQLIVYKPNPPRILLDGAPVYCSDYSMNAGISEFGLMWWNLIYKMFIVESTHAKVISFQRVPVPDVLIGGIPLNFMSQAERNNDVCERGAWHYARLIWMKGLTLLEEDFSMYLDVSYDGERITITTPNNVESSLYIENRPVSETEHPAIRATLSALSAQSGLCFMGGSRFVDREESKVIMLKITEGVSIKIQQELSHGAYMQSRYEIVDVHLYPLAPIVISYL